MTFLQFLTESDEFVLAWNAYTNKNPKAEPIPSQYKRFSKISSKKPPKGILRGCYHNSMKNFQENNLRMVVGLAVPVSDAEHLLRTGEMSWNPKYRGYDHAWNIDDSGAIIDSTYENPKDFRYYGFVVPTVTAKSFKVDNDVMNYVHQINGAHDKDRAKVVFGEHPKKLVNIQEPLPEPFKSVLDSKKFIFHSSSHDKNQINYLYIKKGDNGIKVTLRYNSKTKKIEHIYQESIIHDKRSNTSGPGKVKSWFGDNSWYNWSNNVKPDRNAY